jgi:hypothetical protein
MVDGDFKTRLEEACRERRLDDLLAFASAIRRRL